MNVNDKARELALYIRNTNEFKTMQKTKKDLDKNPTLKITLPNKVSLIKFGSSIEEYDSLAKNGYVEIDVIGKCNKNEWNGWVTPQVFIDDYEVVDHVKYIF